MLNQFPISPGSVLFASCRRKRPAVDGRRFLVAAETVGRVKPIEELEVGDLVWAWDAGEGALVKRCVKRLFRHKDRAILDVLCINQAGSTKKITATSEHPFWIEGKGWVPAQDLESGDPLKCINGVPGMSVLRVVDRREKTDTSVYNFEVEGVHNYFVGHDGVLVHNMSRDPSKSAGAGPSQYWARGARSTPTEALEVHFDKHGAEVSATSEADYTEKALALKSYLLNEAEVKNTKMLRGARSGITGDAVRHMPVAGDPHFANVYVDVDSAGMIVSFGTIVKSQPARGRWRPVKDAGGIAAAPRLLANADHSETDFAAVRKSVMEAPGDWSKVDTLPGIDSIPGTDLPTVGTMSFERSQLEFSLLVADKKEFGYQAQVHLPEGGKQFIGLLQGIRKGGVLTMMLENRLPVSGGYISMKPSGFGVTDALLAKGVAAFQDHFGESLLQTSDSLAAKNKIAFQQEYLLAREMNPGFKPNDLARLAVQRISYGRAREKIGLTNFTFGSDFHFGTLKDVRGRIYEEVPTYISLTASRP